MIGPVQGCSNGTCISYVDYYQRITDLITKYFPRLSQTTYQGKSKYYKYANGTFKLRLCKIPVKNDNLFCSCEMHFLQVGDSWNFIISIKIQLNFYPFSSFLFPSFEKLSRT